VSAAFSGLSRSVAGVGVMASDVVYLADAKLCVDCTAITAAPDGQCAVCASTSLIVLAKVLDRESKR
jgi:hypothetical protein